MEQKSPKPLYPSVLYINNMNSSAFSDSSPKFILADLDTMFPTAKYTSSRRSPSISSLSSISSSSSGSLYFLDDDSPLSPATPLGFSGVPFAWEQLPGIPKKQRSIKKKDSASNIVLPLPPRSASQSPKKLNHAECGNRRRSISSSRYFHKDPFFAALVECSKDGQEASRNFWAGAKVTRSLSERLGLVNLSCKNTCAAPESLVYLPKARRTSHDLINHRLH